MNKQNLLNNFGGRLKELRLKSKLSQEELAATAGLDRTYVSSCERGKRNISLINIYKLSEALKIDIVQLFNKSK